MDTFLSILPILLVFLLYFSSIPIAFAIFGAMIIYFSFINGGTPPDLVFQRYISSTQNFALLAIPFFIMAGSIMNYSGISERLIRFTDSLTGHMKGGLGQTNVVLSLLMGGVSGSANADAAMEAKMLVPEMVRRGYDLPFSAAVTAASSAITPVIPPGINLIVYALIAGCSVKDMFLAGYVPGLLMVVALMVTVRILASRRNYRPTRDRRATGREILAQARESVWALIFPLLIILGMRIGLFTPSEGGAVAVLYTILVGKFVYGQLRLSHFPAIFRETVYGTSAVVLIIVAANVFGYYMNWERIPQAIASSMLDLTRNRYLMLLLCNLIFLVVGMFIEGGAAIIILSPLLVPVVRQLGVHPVHFGLVIIVNIMIGGLTPPFGSMMFTVCTITGCRLTEFVRASWPMILALLIVLMLITYVPELVMLLPSVLG